MVYELENRLAESDLDEGDRRHLSRRLEKMRKALDRREDEEGVMVEALSAVRDRVDLPRYGGQVY